MKTNFIRLTKAKFGEIWISPNHIIAMQPTDDVWFRQTGTRTFVHLSLPLSQCDVKETVEEIVELIKKAENEIQV